MLPYGRTTHIRTVGGNKKEMIKFFVVSMLLFALGCSNDNKLKLYDFGPFTLEGPGTWKVRNVRGTDSYVKEDCD